MSNNNSSNYYTDLYFNSGGNNTGVVNSVLQQYTNPGATAATFNPSSASTGYNSINTKTASKPSFLEGLQDYFLGTNYGGKMGGLGVDGKTITYEAWNALDSAGKDAAIRADYNAPGTSTSSGVGLMDIGGLALEAFNAWNSYEGLKLQEDAFNFNKGMAEKAYAMNKDSYDRNVARSESIGNQMRGTYKSSLDAPAFA